MGVASEGAPLTFLAELPLIVLPGYLVTVITSELIICIVVGNYPLSMHL